MSLNTKPKVGTKYGVKGQPVGGTIGAGGANAPGKPFGYPSGSKNRSSEPKHGVSGQRLSGGSSSSSKSSKFPPHRRGSC